MDFFFFISGKKETFQTNQVLTEIFLPNFSLLFFTLTSDVFFEDHRKDPENQNVVVFNRSLIEPTEK